jgi:hypothetical protein
MSSRLKDVLPLSEFIRRTQTLSMYRKILRIGRQVDRIQHSSGDIEKQIKRDFRHNRTITDPVSIKSMLSEARRHTDALEAMAAVHETDHSHHKFDPTSWINASDEHDERGRVGSDWPWGR